MTTKTDRFDDLFIIVHFEKSPVAIKPAYGYMLGRNDILSKSVMAWHNITFRLHILSIRQTS